MSNFLNSSAIPPSPFPSLLGESLATPGTIPNLSRTSYGMGTPGTSLFVPNLTPGYSVRPANVSSDYRAHLARISNAANAQEVDDDVLEQMLEMGSRSQFTKIPHPNPPGTLSASLLNESNGLVIPPFTPGTSRRSAFVSSPSADDANEQPPVADMDLLPQDERLCVAFRKVLEDAFPAPASLLTAGTEVDETGGADSLSPLVEKYRQLCSEEAVDDNLDPSQKHHLVEESRTWHLVRTLLEEERSDLLALEEHSLSNPRSAVLRHFQSSREWHRVQSVRQWLEEIPAPVLEVLAQPIVLTETAHAIRTGRHNVRGLVSALDPDARFRANPPGRYAPSDEETDRLFVGTLWDLIRRGRMDAAIELCFESNQIARGLMLRGFVVRENAVGSGNPRRRMWKHVCAKMAEDASRVLSSSERCIAAFLAASPDLLWPFVVGSGFPTESWYDGLWTLVVCAMERQIDLLESGSMHAPDTIGLDSMDSILSEYAKRTGRVPEEESPWVCVQRLLILGKYDAAIAECHLVAANAKASSQTIQNANRNTRSTAMFRGFKLTWLRFSVHLVHVLTEARLLSAESASHVHGITLLLVERLKEVEPLLPLVPMYLNYVDNGVADLQMFSILESLREDSVAMKRLFLQTAAAEGYSVESILVRLVDGFMTGARSLRLPGCTGLVSPKSILWRQIKGAGLSIDDERRIMALTWLINFPASLLAASCHLIRQLIINGRLSAALFVGLSSMVVSSESYEGARSRNANVDEWDQWKVCLQSFQLYHTWNDSRKNANAGRVNAEDATEQFLQTVRPVFSSEPLWMGSVPDFPFDELSLCRSRVLPALAFHILDVCMSSTRWNDGQEWVVVFAKLDIRHRDVHLFTSEEKLELAQCAKNIFIQKLKHDHSR
eukprot:ANDGO_08498.mRNA.1 hypothetical protein DICPUDRAFT_97855